MLDTSILNYWLDFWCILGYIFACSYAILWVRTNFFSGKNFWPDLEANATNPIKIGCDGSFLDFFRFISSTNILVKSNIFSSLFQWKKSCNASRSIFQLFHDIIASQLFDSSKLFTGFYHSNHTNGSRYFKMKNEIQASKITRKNVSSKSRKFSSNRTDHFSKNGSFCFSEPKWFLPILETGNSFPK